MPFMIGEAPIRRTLKYLNAGKIIFRDSVKIFSVNYNNAGEHHMGAKDFVFWHLPQIQYKNPLVQCICFKNLTPSPFIKIFTASGRSLLIDVDSRKKEDILHHLASLTIVCKTRDEIIAESKTSLKKGSHAYFGHGCVRHCICEVMGQVPCPGLVPIPKVWRGIPSKKRVFKIPPNYMEAGLEKRDLDE